MSLITVSLCMNDEHGMPSGRVCMVEFGDFEIEMESGFVEDNANPTCSINDANRQLRIGRHLYPIHSHSSHVGNLAWDEVSVYRRVARKMIQHLLKRGFQITGGWVETDLAPADQTGAPR